MTAALGRALADGHVTAVQLRAEGELLARLLCGLRPSVVSGARGDVALLPEGRIAAYVVERRRTTGVYIFRTARGDALSVVPGVSKPVRLLFASLRRGAARRTRNFVRNLTSYGHDPSDLSDDFWLRAAGALIARRRPGRLVLSYLLSREAAP